MKRHIFSCTLFEGLILVIFLFSPFITRAQVGIGTSSPHASSSLEISSTTTGVLISRMTKTQRDAISSSATGLMIYQTDNVIGFYHYNGSAWVNMSNGPVLLETQTASNSATIDFTSYINSTYKRYYIELIDVVPATDQVQLFMRISNDGGSTFEADAGDYAWSVLGHYETNTTNYNHADASDTEMEIVPNGWSIGSAAGEGVEGKITLSNPANAGLKQMFRWEAAIHFHTASDISRLDGVGEYATAEAIDGVRFLFSSGNIESGTFKLYGVP